MTVGRPGTAGVIGPDGWRFRRRPPGPSGHDPDDPVVDRREVAGGSGQLPARRDHAVGGGPGADGAAERAVLLLVVGAEEAVELVLARTTSFGPLPIQRGE